MSESIVSKEHQRGKHADDPEVLAPTYLPLLGRVLGRLLVPAFKRRTMDPKTGSEHLDRRILFG